LHFNNGFFVFESILKHWKKEDFPIVALYLANLDYKAIAIQLDKNRDQIWKREKNLQVKEYFSIKKMLLNFQNILIINE
jgi:predicted nucleic acid-binding protein